MDPFDRIDRAEEPNRTVEFRESNHDGGKSKMRFTYDHRKKGKVVVDLEGYHPQDHIWKHIAGSATFYEQDLLDYIDFVLSDVSEKGVCVDVGANIGNHSVFFGKFLADHVLCIEANSGIRPILQRNLKQNINNYTIYGCAAGENVGTGTVITSSDTNNIGMARVEITAAEKNDDCAVEIRTLDSIVSDFKCKNDVERVRVSLVKIDVEGMELPVLKGAERTLVEDKPHVFVEAATRSEKQAVDSYLKDLGYVSVSRWCATPVYHYCFKPSPKMFLRWKMYELGFKIKKFPTKVRRKLIA